MRKIVITKTSGQPAVITPAMRRAQAKASAPWSAANGTSQKQSGASKFLGCLGVLAVLFLLGIGLLFAVLNTTQTFENKMLFAARDSVQERLVSPSSAKFDSRSEKYTQINYDHYLVTGSLESKNRFGVMLKTEYGVYIQRKENYALPIGGIIGESGWGSDHLGKSLSDL